MPAVQMTKLQAHKFLMRLIRDNMDRRPAVPVQVRPLSPETYWIEEGTLASVESVMGLNRSRILGAARKENR